MKTKSYLTFALAATAAFAAAADDSSAFAKIKALAGTWKGTGSEGSGSGEPMSVKYRVVSGGSAVEETIAPGTPHEMVTMYYLDGKTLMLTHYCMMGNQPRMKLVGGSGDDLKFAFDGGSNCPAGCTCMGGLVVTFASPDHLKTCWALLTAGKEVDHVNMDLTRSPASR